MPSKINYPNVDKREWLKTCKCMYIYINICIHHRSQTIHKTTNPTLSPHPMNSYLNSFFSATDLAEVPWKVRLVPQPIDFTLRHRWMI